jgi:tRNA-splicing ligase RtcB
MNANENYNITIFGEAEDKTVQQLKNCLDVEEGSLGVLCADNHLGYNQPVGAAVAYREHISVSGVGYDIGCGNKAVKTNLFYSDIREHMPKIMDEITNRISFGVGQPNNEEVKDHPVFDSIARAAYEPLTTLLPKARKQLGTVGAGNHYVDLFKDETDHVWIGVHFGSRGFGHNIASGFLALAEGKNFDERAAEGEMSSPPTVFHTGSTLAYLYIDSMNIAGEYAYAGRDVVCDKVLEILGAKSIYEVHNHHNFAWKEEHFGDTFWVVRKGCTPAFPGQEGFVGSTMADDSVILEGATIDAVQSLKPQEQARDSLFSTVHGAGRVMSRTEAAGKSKKRWTCNNRDCDWYQPPHTHKPDDGCPECGHPKLQKRWIQMSQGKVDYEAVKQEISNKGIILKGGAPDEAPAAYKKLEEVLYAHGNTIRVKNKLTPIGVAMAGPDVNDPYKD